MSKSAFSEEKNTIIADSLELRLFRRDLGDAAELFSEMLGTNGYGSSLTACREIGEELSRFIDAVSSEMSSIEREQLWDEIIGLPFTPAVKEHLGFTDLEWGNMKSSALDGCARASLECCNPENADALIYCAERLIESNRTAMFMDGSMENLYRWKIGTARHAVIAAKHVQNGAEVLKAAREALCESACDFRSLWEASARLESAIRKT
ncbi:MAG: hypothetical protein ACREBW_08780 [Candidatus Micrarchaeaceae archaeon]